MRSYPLLKIPAIADPAHDSDVMYVLRFIQMTKPIISSRIIRFQVEQTNNIVALAIFIFILNISVEQTKFQYNGGSISNRNLIITLSIDIYEMDNVKSFTQALTYTTRLLTSTEFKKIYVHRFTSLRRYIWRFLSKIECCNVVSEGILKFLPLFTISTLSNDDVIHGVPGYFKCR